MTTTRINRAQRGITMKTMKQAMKMLTLALLVIATAQAAGPITVKGKWSGVAFASVIDLDHDGNPARTFDIPVYDQLVFSALQGVVDASLLAPPGQGSCSDPGAFELVPMGTIILRGWGANAMYATVDSSQHLCFNPATPDETLTFIVTGGRGIFAGKTGQGVAHLHDVTVTASATGFPLVVDSVGEFSVTFQ
jgi:hypothetical protein